VLNTIKLSPKGLRWLRSGHLWVYRDDLLPGGEPSRNGEVVRVESSVGTFLAQAFFSQKSKIALRVISFEEAALDREFYRARLAQCRERRGQLFSPDTACRLVSAEGDLFPGLIVDHYAGHLVVQVLIPGVEQLRPLLMDLLEELFSPRSITLRGDLAVRELEGLAQEKVMLQGEPPRAVEVTEGTVRYLADLWEGHKTGAYLDQQQNRLAVSGFGRGRALDGFCYQGHFALHLARICAEVTAVDSSAPALARLEENCELNQIKNVVPERANVFDDLGRREARGERFDLIVLDPPPFAKSRRNLAGAAKGYRDLNRRALSMLNPGGRLLTYSCSYNLSPEAFLNLLREAAAEARRQVRVLESQAQSPDHPILLAVPETHYLKGLVLEVAD
jgi:23S rRNA (cytosine1962-C5)-methyltransferase